MNRVFFVLMIFGAGMLFVQRADAACAGNYTCARQTLTGQCDYSTTTGNGFCSGSNSSCGTFAANQCPGQCVYLDNCSEQCSYSACAPNDGHSCSAGQVYIDLSGTGQTSCTGSSGCFNSPSCVSVTDTQTPGCGTCNPGPNCPPACGSSCGGTCSGNGQACTINGPACPVVTNTPVPCNIQGRKVIMPDNRQITPAIGQTITVAGVGSTTNNSYGFTVTGGQNYTVTSSDIPGTGDL